MYANGKQVQLWEQKISTILPQSLQNDYTRLAFD